MEKGTYRPFLAFLAGFATLRSTFPSSPSLGSSSDPPLLFRVLRLFGGSLGSDSPRLRVAWAFGRRVERGAIVVESRRVWAKGTLTWAKGSQQRPYLESEHNYVYTVLIFTQMYCLFSLMVYDTCLLKPRSPWFNPRCLH